MRFALLATLLALVAPQSVRPDFSGKWVLTDGGENGVLGRGFAASQDATTLSLEVDVPPRDSQQGWTKSRTTYTLNGERRESFEVPEKYLKADPASIWWLTRVAAVHRTGWYGNTLVIVTHVTNEANVPIATPRRHQSEWVQKLALTLDASGHLVVEESAIHDPFPWDVPHHMVDAIARVARPSRASKSVYTRAR